MKIICPATIVMVMLFSTAFIHAKEVASAPIKPVEKPLIQIAILLDTSGSMIGLINQARTHLWSIVNQFALSSRDGQTPALEVALYEYGNRGLSGEEGYIRQVVAFTDDLDGVSQGLFSLSTNGGEEYCGQVIARAVEQLAWSPREDVFKAIFIAGNEPFTQGPVNYEQSCRSAITKSILVNTIHCGDYKQGIDDKWQHGSQLADGSYLHIDQNHVLAVIAAPQDDELLRLNSDLNTTYCWFGDAREAAMANQYAQDSNAAAIAPQANAARIGTKAGKLYRNRRSDLVDALEDEEFALAEVDESKLPEAMREMTPEERQVYVEQQSQRRGELRQQIAELTKARDAYVAVKRLQETAAGEDSLGDAIIATVRGQLGGRGFELVGAKE